MCDYIYMNLQNRENKIDSFTHMHLGGRSIKQSKKVIS